MNATAPSRARRRLAGVAILLTAALVAVACGQKSGVHLAASGVNGGVGAGNGAGGTSGGEAINPQTGQPEAGGTTSGGANASTTGTGGASTTGGGGAATTGGAGTTGGGTTGAGTTGGTTGVSGPADRTGVSDTQIVVGIHAPATGAGAPAPSFDTGKDVYFNFIGNGINGRKVKVIFADDGYNPGQAVSACKTLVEVDHVFLIIGGAGTDQIVACAQYANSVGVPYVAEGVTEQGLDRVTSYFAESMTYKAQGALLAAYIKNVLHKTKVAMVRGNTANFEDAHTGFINAAKADGLTVVKDLAINKDATQAEANTAASEVCTSVPAGSTPDLVVYPLMSPKVFISMAGAAAGQQCFPHYAGVGISLSINTVTNALCPTGAFKSGATFFAPFQGLDQADPQYGPAYSKQHPGQTGDDIGYIIWGLEKLVSAELIAAGRDLSRQSFLAAVSGHSFPYAGSWPAVDFTHGHFGGTAVHVLVANCAKNPGVWDTQFQNRSSF